MSQPTKHKSKQQIFHDANNEFKLLEKQYEAARVEYLRQGKLYAEANYKQHKAFQEFQHSLLERNNDLDL